MKWKNDGYAAMTDAGIMAARTKASLCGASPAEIQREVAKLEDEYGDIILCPDIYGPHCIEARPMTVRVVDRDRMDLLWGTPAFTGVVIREINVSRKCPICGGPRGKPKLRRFHEFGEYYEVHMWTNPCGHLDSYRSILDEAYVDVAGTG